MSPNIFERLQARIELFRLEQRYTRRRNRRSTFVSNAVYVDGEYVYQTPNATGSSTGTNDSQQEYNSHSESASPDPERPTRRLNRFSSMPGFGSLAKRDSMRAPQDWRTQRASSDEMR